MGTLFFKAYIIEILYLLGNVYKKYHLLGYYDACLFFDLFIVDLFYKVMAN